MARNKRDYQDSDKARVWIALQANEDNANKTGMETGVSPRTIRTWREQWRKDGGPPDSVLKLVRSAREDFVSRMEVARGMAMDRLVEIIPDIKNAQQAAMVIGILDDKIARARNVRVPEVAPQPASLDEVQGQVGQWLLESIAKAASRRVDTIESTAVEQADTQALTVVGREVGAQDE